MKQYRKSLIYLGFTITLILGVIGISYTMYLYTGTGSKANSITTGKIVVNFNEKSNIIITNRYPETDARGIANTDSKSISTFTVSSDISGEKTLSYAIGLVNITEGKTLKSDYIKIYMTKNGSVAPGFTEGVGKTVKSFEELSIAGHFDSHAITTGILTGNQVDNYTIKAWIDEKYNLPLNNTNNGTTHSNTTTSETYSFKIKLVAIDGNLKIQKPMTTKELVAKANPESLDYASATSTQKLEMWEHSHPATEQTGALTDYRYIGANPNNYINFNNEVWRIIGVFTVDDGKGKLEQRIKIIRNESIGNYSYDNKIAGVGSSTSARGSNEWSDSTIQVILNSGHYYNPAKGMCPSGSEEATTECDFTTIGLTDIAKSQIDNAVYYLGGTASYEDSATGLASHWYSYERGNERYDDTRSLFWPGKIGLMYVSDYGYATSGGDTTNRATCLETELASWNQTSISDCKDNNWIHKPVDKYRTIVPKIDASNDGFNVSNSGRVNSDGYVDRVYGIFPVAYLKSDIMLIGTGTSADPYIIG